MIVAVASGKGGTGKTTVSAALSLALSDGGEGVSYLDCDVEEPNGHLYLKPDISGSHGIDVTVPEIDQENCDRCGICSRVCVYNALVVLESTQLFFKELCHSCGCCWHLCPRQAINKSKRCIGVVETGLVRGITFVQGRLNVGEVMSPHLIEAVKTYTVPGRTTVIDAPPGTSCPAMKTIEGTDFCLLVAESTPFGIHDMDPLVRVLSKLQIPAGVVVNRSDGDDSLVQEYCGEKNIPLLATLPFARDIAEGCAQGLNLVEIRPDMKSIFINIFEKIKGMKSR